MYAHVYQETWIRIYIAYINKPRLRKLKYPLRVEWIIRSAHIIVYHAAMKMNILQLHVISWLNMMNLMLG